MKTVKEKCGCAYTAGERQQWTEMCADHKAEADELHARWNAEYRVGAAQRDAEGFYAKSKPAKK